MNEKEKLIKQLVAKTFKEFGCYKRFRRNFNNPRLWHTDAEHTLTLNLLNGEVNDFSMKRIIFNAFLWGLSVEGTTYWNIIYSKVYELDLYIKATPNYSVFDPYVEFTPLYKDSIL